MSFVKWLAGSPFATPWFDALLAGILLFEILPFFFRARAARLGFTAASLLCQVGLLISCLYLGATLPETLLVLAVAALIASVSSLVEYRRFNRAEVETECEAKAEASARIARERAEAFVLPRQEKKSAGSDVAASDGGEEGGDEA
ncbi:MAG: hypothetical protein J6Z04_00950 [Clostridia bacterium]|nr:hypothetical protein [Clostridia bacterium]